jgi:transposase InsO family protein
VEFDMKHINLLGTKLYAFCALDNGSREGIIHIASSPSSRNAKRALREVVARFGCGIKIVNDNGSENKKDAEEFLAENSAVQYWARPYRPKDKPHIERFIGTFQREFLDECYGPMTAAELQETADKWLDKYHHYRPHEALDCMTPAEFSAKMDISIPRIGKRPERS